MDRVLEKIAQDTVSFKPGDEDIWRTLYEPLYGETPKNVGVIKDERYGPAERNQLDVYFPLNDENHDKAVLLFVHGGGFFSGDKGWSEKCYANIGYFFAQHGLVVVIANHQLVPHVVYPGGADDMQRAREWIYHNIASEKYGRGSPEKVILFGHSSGGAHIAMNLYAAGEPNRRSTDALFPPVAGVMYLSVPFWFDVRKPVRRKIIGQYYGSPNEEIWGPLSPVGLFRNLPEDSPLLDSTKVPVYIGSVKWEVEETADACILFFNAYRERSKPAGTLPFFHVLDRHNHLSNVLSIGTTDTIQGDKLLEFIEICVENVEKNQRVRRSLAHSRL